MLTSIRQLGVHTVNAQAWPTGTSSELAQRSAANAMPEMPEMNGPGMSAAATHRELDLAHIDRLVPVVVSWHLAYPVLIAPPSKADPSWSARSDAQNRPQRVTIELDPATGRAGARRGFDQLPIVDQVVAVGVGAHEGQLFTPVNQALALITALALFVASSSAIVLWWKRRAPHVLVLRRRSGCSSSHHG